MSRFAKHFAAFFTVAAITTAFTEEVSAMTPYPGGRFSPSPEKYGQSVDAGVPIKVDDGTVLRADITYPTDLATGKRAEGPFPVILSQDIYSVGPTTVPPALAQSPLGPVMIPWSYFVPRGYIFVHLNVRGTGGSEGTMDLHGKRTGLDGVFVAQWVADPANVKGSNGTVGLEGCSALGVVQLNTLAQMGELERLGKLDPQKNPVKASIAKCISGDGYHDLLFDNGIPTVVWYGIPPSPAVGGFDLPGVLSGGSRGYHHDAFWTERDRIRLADDIARTGVPILTTVGWKEAAFIGAFEMYAALQNSAAGRPYLGPMAAGQRLSPKYQTIIGDWGHGGGLDRGIEEEWFATWLKGEDTGMQNAKTSLHVKELPSGKTARWLGLQGYPAEPTATQYFLDAQVLRTSPPKKAVSQKLKWAQQQSVSYTLGKPFDRDVTLVGPSAVTVWVVSSNSDIQLFAQLNDVAPDGSVSHITHASILGSRRTQDAESGRSWTTSDGVLVRPWLTLGSDDPLQPGEPAKLDIPLQPTAWRLAAGHRLQLVLYSQPPKELCDGAIKTIAPPPLGCWWTTPMVFNLAGGEYQILQGPDHASSLNVTIVPSDSLPTVRSGVTPTSSEIAQPLDW